MTSPGLAAPARQPGREQGTGTAPAAGPAIRSGLVPPLADGFTLRAETASCLAALTPGAVVALASESSRGKTQLAVHAAETLCRSGQVRLLAWVDASSRASALAGYAQAATAVGTGTAGPAEQAAARLAGWLAATTWPWLLVLDDLRDPADLDGLWPGGPAGRVLITTRDRGTISADHGQPGVHVLPVGAFSTREALNYLMSRLDPDQRHGAIDLAIALEGDPVALTHASAVVATTDQSCRDYQHHYADQLALAAARQDSVEPVAPAAVTWQLSAGRAEQLCPGGAARQLLAIAAVLDGQPIPAPLFTTPAVLSYLARAGAPASAGHACQALRALEDTGLIALDPSATPAVARVSRPVAALARADLPRHTRDLAGHATADALLSLWPRPEPQPWLAAVLRSCAGALQQTAAGSVQAGAGHLLLRRAGHSLDAARLTGPAAGHWARLAQASDRALGPGHPDTLTTAACLATALLAAGQPAQAATWWRWVAAGRRRARGPDHPQTLAAQIRLGAAMAAGQHPDAITVLDQATTACQRVCGPDHPDTFAARGELAAACQGAGRAAQAIGHRQAILADLEHLHDAGHPAVITARDDLAAAYLAVGQHEDAITCYKKTLADRQRAHDSDPLGVIAARRNLAAACQTAGRLAAALQQHQHACAESERVLGAGHPGTLACRADLVAACHAAGRLTDAATLARDTLARCERTLPPGHPTAQAIEQTLAGL